MIYYRQSTTQATVWAFGIQHMGPKDRLLANFILNITPKMKQNKMSIKKSILSVFFIVVLSSCSNEPRKIINNGYYPRIENFSTGIGSNSDLAHDLVISKGISEVNEIPFVLGLNPGVFDRIIVRYCKDGTAQMQFGKAQVYGKWKRDEKNLIVEYYAMVSNVKLDYNNKSRFSLGVFGYIKFHFFERELVDLSFRPESNGHVQMVEFGNSANYKWMIP